MTANPRIGRGRALAGCVILLAAGCTCSERQRVTVLAAASLSRVMADLEQAVERADPRVDVVLELSGSQAACRKISELGRRADVVATADHRVIDTILRPAHAGFTIRFASNEIVLAHMEHSRYTEEITRANWPAILLRPDVRLGGVDPGLSPLGYRTLLVWQLAERHLGDAAAGLARRLRARLRPEHSKAHESELLKLLQARAVDYLFVYRSTAEAHNLKTVRLPAAYNLGSLAQARTYATASVRVRIDRERTLTGEPVIYGVTIPRQPLHRAGALAFVRALLSDPGRAALQRHGFDPLRPPLSADHAALPAELRAHVQPLPR